MVLDSTFPYDERVEKEALSLIEMGMDVYLLCHTHTQQPEEELYKNIHIIRFKLNLWFKKKLLPLYLILPVYRFIWKKKIFNLIKNKNIDVLHFHDLPLSDIGVLAKKRFNVKLVCDQHEYYSNWIKKAAHYNTFIGKIVNYLSRWKKYEKINLSQADLVITVSEPLRQLYISKIGLDENKIIVVPNTPSITLFNSLDKNIEKPPQYINKFVLFYAGTIDILRGLDFIIDALPHLYKKIPNIKFIFSGKIYKSFDPLEYAKKIGISHCIEYLGWLNIEELPKYIAASDICIFTPPPNREEINSTIPTKIYQYLAMKKPIIVSEAKMMKDFVEKNKIGFSVKYGSIETLINTVLDIFNNYSTIRHNIEKNSKRLIDTGDIFWENTVKILKDRYSYF